MDKLDVYVREDLTDVIQRMDQTFTFDADSLGVKLVAVGFAMNYKNWFCAVPKGFVNGFKSGVANLEGVYVNEYPPEILASMDEEI